MKELLRLLLPPICVKVIRTRQKYGWFGYHSTWEDARKRCSGYDSEAILIACRDALLKVKNGFAAYERDSVIFSRVQYSWPLLSGLLTAAVENGGSVNVLDFGGSLGSSYYQNLGFLKKCKNYQWNIVEQKHFVACGKDCFEDHHLKFYETIEECLSEQRPNVLLLSSVLQYLEKPHEMLERLIGFNIDYLILERTSFIEKKDDVILIQKVPPSIYDASYPCWAFSEKKLMELFAASYDVMAEFDALDKSNLEGMYFKGYILKNTKEKP